MKCDMELHEGLIELGDDICPFCKWPLGELDEKPQEHTAKFDLCCDCQDIINNDGMIVCRSCGVVQGYKMAKEYVNFYENIHKMKRKSVYHRKYHLYNILMDIGIKHKVIFSFEQKNKIMRIFTEIDKILPQINGERKRMISLNFIMRQVLRMMCLPFNKIQISGSKKTLASCQKYWDQIIGDRIEGIIDE